MTRPLVSVIVPVRDDPEGIRALLARLDEQTVPRDRFEVVIGDDGSRPDAVPRVSGEGRRIRVVRGPPRTSYAARNRAVAAARGAILAFTDSDCRPEPTWLEKGLAALERADLVAGEVRFHVPPKPTVWSLLTVDMFLDQHRAVRLSRAVTANLLVRRERFDSLGGFDDSLPSGGDYDFAGRMVAAGGRLVYAPDAVVVHPTMDAARPFLRKVWRTNRWAAARRKRLKERPSLIGLFAFVPFLGVALARRHALRSPLSLELSRLRACGVQPRMRDHLHALSMVYFVIAYVAGFAQVRGWLGAAPAGEAAAAGRAVHAAGLAEEPRARRVGKSA